MILNAQTTPNRAPRSFDKRVWLVFRVVDNITLRIGHEQSEVTGDSGTGQPDDGIKLNQASTNPPTGNPYGTWWKGDLWFSASVAGKAVVINTGEFDDESDKAVPVPASK